MKRTLLVAVATLALLLAGTPAQASTVRIRFNMDAASLAKKLGCKRIVRQSNSGTGARFKIKNSVVCHLKHQRVNVITFKSYPGQQRWENSIAKLAWAEAYAAGVADAAEFWYDYWASAHGAVIVSKNLTRKAACVGAKALAGNPDSGAFRMNGLGEWERVTC